MFRLKSWFLILGLMTFGYPADGDQTVWRGIRAWYNYDTGQSVTILDSARNLYPDHPTVHLVYAAARYQHSQAFDPVEENYRILAGDLAEIIPVYEQLVAKYPDQPIYRLYYGSAVGLEARIHLGRKEWIKTLIAAYRGFSIISEVARENPDLIDAQLPVGIVKYYAALSGGLVKLAVKIFGIDASKEQGRQAILRAADEGDFAWMEAKGILAYLDIYIEDDVEAVIPHVQDLAREFPRNWYYRQLLAECRLRAGHLDQAAQTINSLEQQFPDLRQAQQITFGGYLSYERGALAFARGDLEEAERILLEGVQIYGAELDAVLGQTYLLLGMLNDLNGNREQARDYYRKTIKLDNYCYAMDWAQTYLEKPYRQ